MERDQDDELGRLKELLRHTSEFIAYFEVAETKMLQWREDIERQANQIQTHTQKLQTELLAVQNLLSSAGTDHFRKTAEQALSQGDQHLQRLEQQCQQFTQSIEDNQEKIEALSQQCLYKIEHYSTQSTQAIAQHLAKYDVHQFHRIASESCDHVERVANDAVSKSNKLLSMFQLRLGLFAVFTTILTAFVIVLYLSDELPWEIHRQAMNERQAGKVLLQAWPNLSQEEKAKILNEEGLDRG